eukprot:6975791-Alexandrium_andersonii.AAC.1
MVRCGAIVPRESDFGDVGYSIAWGRMQWRTIHRLASPCCVADFDRHVDLDSVSKVEACNILLRS